MSRLARHSVTQGLPEDEQGPIDAGQAQPPELTQRKPVCGLAAGHQRLGQRRMSVEGGKLANTL